MNANTSQIGELLAAYLRPHWRRAGLLALLLFVGVGLQLLSPQILRRFLDAATGDAPPDRLSTLAALFLAAGLATQVTSVFATYLSNDLGWLATNDLRVDLADRTLRMDLPFHHSVTPGMLIERIDGDTSALANFFSRFVLLLAGNLLLLTGVLVVLYLTSWPVGLAFTVFCVIALLVLNHARGVASPQWARQRQASAELYGFLEERVSGIEDIRPNGGTSYASRRLQEALGSEFRAGRAARVMTEVFSAATALLLALGTVLALAAGVWLYQTGRASIGTVYMLAYYAALIARPLRQISTQADDFQSALASVRRVQELRELRSKLQDGEGRALPPSPPPIQFEGIRFGYVEGAPVLEDVSFRLQAGRVLGLLGRTGSGKTTIVRLLARLYDPDEGEIRLGGVDLREFRLEDLSRYVGVVSQEVELFDASVRDNVTLFNPDVPDERILDAIRQLGLWGWYESLREGLDTRVGGLSAGEAQMLALARIFLRDLGVVILDEPTSRLDLSTEGLLGQAVERLLQGRTAVVIAHRLSTVERVHDILILEEGRIVEQGERESLARDPDSRFHHLLRVGMEEVVS